MTGVEFENLMESRFASIRELLSKKAVEYADSDRLHNFKEAALISDQSPAKCCVGFFLKHIVSLRDIVDAAFDFEPRSRPS